MNRIFLAAALATTGFAGVVAIGPSVAQTAPVPAPMPAPPAVQTRADAMAMADARFDKMDANKDGKLTGDELLPRGGPGGPGMAPPAAGATPPAPPAAGATPPAGGQFGGRMLARLDTNGDGSIDRSEFRAQAARRFDRLDTNKDSKIDAAEREAARDMMGMRPGRGGKADDMPPPPPPPAPEVKPGQ